MAGIVHTTRTAIVTRFSGLSLYRSSMSFFRQPYFRWTSRLALCAWAPSTTTRARPSIHALFGLPRPSLGTTRTRGLLRNLLTLPDFAGVRTYSTPPSSTNHKGVATAAPLFLYVTRLRYFRLV